MDLRYQDYTLEDLKLMANLCYLGYSSKAAEIMINVLYVLPEPIFNLIYEIYTGEVFYTDNKSSAVFNRCDKSNSIDLDLKKYEMYLEFFAYKRRSKRDLNENTVNNYYNLLGNNGYTFSGKDCIVSVIALLSHGFSWSRYCKIEGKLDEQKIGELKTRISNNLSIYNINQAALAFIDFIKENYIDIDYLYSLKTLLTHYKH